MIAPSINQMTLPINKDTNPQGIANWANNFGRGINFLTGQTASQTNDFAFQEYMRDTQYESLFEQAKKLGISPSLLLGEKGVASGVSGSTGNAGSGNAVTGLINGVLNTITNIFKESQKSERQEDRLQAQEQRQENYLQNMKEMRTSVTEKRINANFPQRKYSEEELNNLFDNVKKVKWK